MKGIKQLFKATLDIDIIRPEIARVVVVVGKTGTGKSTIINMLYNQSSLKENLKGPCKIGASTDSVTKKTKWYFNAVDKRVYGDTIGFSDPTKSDIEIALGLKALVTASQGGVHCIVIVLKYGRISREERTVLKMISEVFDKRWINNCIVIATHYDGDIDSNTNEICEEHKVFIISFLKL